MNKRLFQTLIVAVITIFSTSSLYAQEKGDMAVGGGLSISTGDDHTNFGIGGKFQWNPINYLRLEPSMNFHFKSKHWSFWDLSANVHYLFPINDKFTLYPLAGLGLQNLKVHFKDYSSALNNVNDTQFAFNLGGGVDYAIADDWFLNFEFKYKIADSTNRAVFSLGAGYKF